MILAWSVKVEHYGCIIEFIISFFTAFFAKTESLAG